MSLNNRGSVNANEWAAKRKEQMDRAQQLRNDRKNGVSSSSNTLKGAGQEFVHRANSNSGRSN